MALPSLSIEIRQKLMRVRPGTLGQASRIEGMTPAALACLLGHIKRQTQRKTA
jgi:tRNA uridine 5-carboxymethylaminomethyl modification enzyme